MRNKYLRYKRNNHIYQTEYSNVSLLTWGAANGLNHRNENGPPKIICKFFQPSGPENFMLDETT